MPGHPPGIALSHDPELARQLLAEAGFAGGQGFPPVEAFAWSSAYDDISRYLQLQWREHLGIEIAWRVVDLLTWQGEQVRGRMDHPYLLLGGWLADYPDPHSFLGLRGPTTLPLRWVNRAYSALIERAMTARDQAQRIKFYRQADRIAAQEAVIMPLTYNRSLILVQPWVRWYPTSPIAQDFFKDVILDPH